MLCRNKKGALELSITAIVVLIIAITVLGLAIFFIKDLFGGGRELFTGEFAKIKEQLRKNLEETGELVVMSKGTELEVKRGERYEFHIGARNTDAITKCFRIAIQCVKPFTIGRDCTDRGESDIVGGMNEFDEVPEENWFPRLLSQFDVEGGDISVSPVTLQVSRADPDTYLMQLLVYKGDTFCADGPSWEEPQTKTFHVVLS